MKMRSRKRELQKHGEIAREHVAVFTSGDGKAGQAGKKWHEPNARIQHAATLNATRACAATQNTNAR